MVGACNPDQPLRLGSVCEDALQYIARRVLIVIAADEELWHGAFQQKSVAVAAAFRCDRQAQPNQPLDASVPATGAQADTGTKGETGEENRAMVVLLHPGQRRTNILLLADTTIVRAFAQPDAAKVEAKHRQPEP